MKKNYRQIKAREANNKKRILSCNPTVNDDSGIYILTRAENGFKYAYIGQAKHILTRLAQHLVGYQHIDLSLRKHELNSNQNPTGWKIGFVNYPEHELDKMEQYFIKEYASAGYQLRNKTSGSQGKGKEQIAEFKPAKGYYDGVKQGYINAQKEVAVLFQKYLKVDIKAFKKDGEPTVNAVNAINKFEQFLGVEPKESANDRLSLMRECAEVEE